MEGVGMASLVAVAVSFIFLMFPLRGVYADDDYFTVEGNALIEFKKNITHDPNKVLNTWNVTDPANHCIGWFYVFCTEDHKVTEILLGVDDGGYGLSGQLSPSLANLTSLQKLELQNNNLTGSVSPALADFLNSTVAYVNLIDNLFDMSVPCSQTPCSTPPHN